MGRHPHHRLLSVPPTLPKAPGLLTAINHPSPPWEGLPHSPFHWSPLSGPLRKASPLQPKGCTHQSPHLRSFIIDPSVPLLICSFVIWVPPAPKFQHRNSLGARERAWECGDWGAQALPPRQCRGPTPAVRPCGPLVCCVTLGRGPPSLSRLSRTRADEPGGTSAAGRHLCFLRPFPGSARHREQGNESTCRLSVHLFISVSHRRRCLPPWTKARCLGRETHGHGSLPPPAVHQRPRRLLARPPQGLRDLPACVSQSPCESTQEEAPGARGHTFREGPGSGCMPHLQPHRPRDEPSQSLISSSVRSE